MPYLDEELKRMINRRQQFTSRLRRGLAKKPRRCFRCLTKHQEGERNCPLAAEYEHDWRVESDMPSYTVNLRQDARGAE